MAVEEQRLALIKGRRGAAGAPERYVTPLQREINAVQNGTSKYAIALSPTSKAAPTEDLTTGTGLSEDSTISYDHFAFLQREKKRVNHYMSPDCAGYFAERSEGLGDVLKTNEFG